MTKSRRKLQMRVKRARRDSVRAKKRFQKAVASYKKLVKKYKAA